MSLDGSPAAVAALVTLGGEEALRVVDRERLWRFLLRMCVLPVEGGGMTMHQGGAGSLAPRNMCDGQLEGGRGKLKRGWGSKGATCFYFSAKCIF
jgi:hypothetical protein